ncbi:MAG: acyl-CoA dehydrogenase [Rhodospirillales bacterium]|nr:acyl-CoA dehydrogenase [Rhodospirillales bacterium]
MDFSIPPEDAALQDAVRKFAARQLAPRASHYDETGEFPWEHIKPLSELGVMGLNIPESLGGAGVSALGLALAMEEITAACAGTASMVGAHYLFTDTLLLGADRALQDRYLVPAAKGERLGAYALTEPQAGSDPAGMRTRAYEEGDGWRIEGVKHFITNGAEADAIVVFAKTDPDAGHRGISALVVEKGTPGFSVARKESVMGVRGSPVYELAFSGCRVPKGNMVGAPGTGFKTAMRVLDRSRVEVAAMSLGLARAALDAAVAWAKERKAFGHAVADFQGIQWMLADMATELDAARLLTYRAAWMREKGEGRYSRESAMAKLFASEMVGRVTDLALQIHGGYGYSKSLPLERYVRDARILRIFEGTSELQRNIIAREMLR